MTSWLQALDALLDSLTNERAIMEQKNIATKKHLLPMYAQLKTTTNKKALGLEINQLKQALDELVNKHIQRANNSCDQLSSKHFNLSLTDPYLNSASAHLLNVIIDDVANFFKLLNFDIVCGDEVVLTTMNFDHLNIDENHPARANADSFFINHAMMLRTHCTTTTAQMLYDSKQTDLRIMSYGNVYRKDDDDLTHSHQFMQIDFVWVKKGLNIANLKWLIDELIKYLFGAHLKTRYRLSFFPFTEPSFEVDVQCFKCNLQGCAVCKYSTWIEIMGYCNS